jgi:hypothetical protein
MAALDIYDGGLDKLLAAYYQLHPAQNGRLGMVDFGHMPWSKTMQMGNRHHGRMCHEDSLIGKSEFVISRNLGCAENLPLVDECRFPRMVKVPACAGHFPWFSQLARNVSGYR